MKRLPYTDHSYTMDSPLMDKTEMDKFFEACRQLQAYVIGRGDEYIPEISYWNVLAEPAMAKGTLSSYNIGERNPVTWEDGKLLTKFDTGSRFYMGPWTEVSVRTGQLVEGELENVLFRMENGIFVDAGEWGSLP